MNNGECPICLRGMEVLLTKATVNETSKKTVMVPEVWLCRHCAKIVIDSDRLTVIVMPRRMSA